MCPASASTFERGAAFPGACSLVGIALPLFGGGYWGVIATRACIYWVLVSGLNLVVGFGGQIAIGWVALLTLGAYTTSVLVAGNVTPALPPYLALAIAAVVGADLRRHRRPAGAAAAHLLFRHHDARLRHHRHPGGAGLAERHRRRRRRAGPVFPEPFDLAWGFYYFCLDLRGDLHLDDGQYRARAASAAR